MLHNRVSNHDIDLSFSLQKRTASEAGAHHHGELRKQYDFLLSHFPALYPLAGVTQSFMYR